MLLKIAKLSRSIYYYYLNKEDVDSKNYDIIEKIKEKLKGLTPNQYRNQSL